MTTMKVALPNSLKSFVDDQVTTRGYASSSEHVRDLIRKDRDRQRLRGLLLEGWNRRRRSPPTGIISTDSAAGFTKSTKSERRAGEFP